MEPMKLEELVRSRLSDLLGNVQSGERLGRGGFLRPWNTRDITSLGAVADFARERAAGGRALYRYQAHLNYTGRPIASCPECDAQRQPCGSARGVEYIAQAGEGNGASPVGETHITGGTEAGKRDAIEHIWTAGRNSADLNAGAR